jgi:hypothetical protein
MPRSGTAPGAFVDEGPTPKLSIRRRLPATSWCRDDANGRPAAGNPTRRP